MNSTIQTLLSIHGRSTSTRSLHYNDAQRLFFGCISDTNGLHRVFEDSMDTGMALESHRTGKHVVFVVSHVEVDADGDVRWWILNPVHSTMDLTIQLFND